jgi:DNA-binding CsgD family transcriptional regulator
MRTAADVLILNNVIMVIIGLVVVYLSYVSGLLFGMLLLMAVMLVVHKLPEQLIIPEKDSDHHGIQYNLGKGFLLLLIFIFTVSINVGLAYQVLLPSFSHLGMLVNFYWSFPYILSLIIIRNLPRNSNRNYLLYLAIAMTGFAYIGYMWFDRSLFSFIFICTLTFLAKGIFDLFWWSIIGGMLDLTDHPIRILGGGITISSLGMLAGGIIGNFVLVMQYDSKYSATIALAMVFIVLILMPPLHSELSAIMKNHVYLNQLSELPSAEQTDIIKMITIIENLTERESEIAALLMQGRTYKMISAELYLSENTIKTHIKNIYSKLNVSNKTELINRLLERHNFQKDKEQ